MRTQKLVIQKCMNFLYEICCKSCCTYSPIFTTC